MKKNQNFLTKNENTKSFIKNNKFPNKMLHHITAITEKIKENYEFYTKTLGMTFVKKTVNFDDPTTYHLYYGDKDGNPGSLITFFYYEGKGQRGQGYAEGIIMEVPTEIYAKLGPIVEDPDGLTLKLKPGKDYKTIGVITTANKDFLEKWGFDSENEYKEYEHEGQMGAGIIHHVAHQTPNVDTQRELKKKLNQEGIRTSDIIERTYFKSIYFQEENSCLQEVATNGPGFFIDEEELGSKLVLPPWYEKYRKEIEARLPEL